MSIGLIMQPTSDASSIATGSSERPSSLPAVSLLELPPEVISHIASFLDLPTLLRFLSLHPLLLSLTQTHLSPLRPAALSALAHGPPYPRALAALPSLTLFAPPSARLYVDVLVRARPRWVLERFELGRWREDIWQEAFERRFLPSWKRYKGEDDTWRAVFLRVLGRLEHRYNGCTHDESWTRFITLHKNGSASLNRVYSRMFEPYDIYDELKFQNGNAAHETHVRVVCHLQDVRVLALGVLVEQPSLSVNHNAHAVLHPPDMMRGAAKRGSGARHRAAKGKARQTAAQPARIGTPRPAVPAIEIPARTGASAFGGAAREDRAASPSAPTPARAGTSPSLRTAISSWIPSRVRRLSNVSDGEGDGAAAGSSVMARGAGGSGSGGGSGDGRRRSWSLTRTRAPVGPGHRHGMHGGSAGAILDSPPVGGAGLLPPAMSPRVRPTTPPMPTLPETQVERNGSRVDRSASASASASGLATPADTGAERDDVPISRLPYAPLTHPTPASSHALYPNMTPCDSFMVCIPHHPARSGSTSAAADGRWILGHADRRGLYAESADTEVIWGAEDCAGPRMAEVSNGVQRRWIGSMILVAQLHPTDRREAHPPGTNPGADVEGAGVDLGPRGMYASLGFEDIDALFPWVRLKASGAYSSDPRRSGMGFE